MVSIERSVFGLRFGFGATLLLCGWKFFSWFVKREIIKCDADAVAFDGLPLPSLSVTGTLSVSVFFACAYLLFFYGLSLASFLDGSIFSAWVPTSPNIL